MVSLVGKVAEPQLREVAGLCVSAAYFWFSIALEHERCRPYRQRRSYWVSQISGHGAPYLLLSSVSYSKVPPDGARATNVHEGLVGLNQRRARGIYHPLTECAFVSHVAGSGKAPRHHSTPSARIVKWPRISHLGPLSTESAGGSTSFPPATAAQGISPAPT